MPEKSGIDVALRAPLLAEPTVGANVCPKADVETAAKSTKDNLADACS
jgi:hypothetical protein